MEKDLNLRLRQQEAIARLGEYALGCQDLDDLFREAVQSVAETLEMEYCKVLQLLPGGQSLLLRTGIGWQEGLVGTATVGTELDSQAGYTLITDEPVIVEDLRTEARFSGPALLREHNVVSGMSVIIRGKDRPFGVLGVHSSRPHVFHPNDTRFIKAVASILATAIQRFSAEDELRRSHDQLEIILQGVTEGVTVQDRNGELVYANQAAARLMGYQSVEEARGFPLSEIRQRFRLLDEHGNPFPSENLPGQLIFAGERFASTRIRFQIKETGEERWSIVEAAPIYDETGQPYQAVNIFRDITEMVLSEQYQRFLAEVGSLLASSLDYEQTLTNVAQLSVTYLADWCSIYLLNESQEPFLLTIAHRDPAKRQFAQDYQEKYPLDLKRDKGAAKVLKTGQAEYYPVITDELLEASINDPEQLRMIRALGMKSVLVVPLIARGRTLGAISLVWAESGRRSSQRDVELSHELARRAAIAIDNARLYRDAQRLNTELEQRVAARTEELFRANQRLETEIDERRKTELALQKSELMLRSLFESAPDAIFLVTQTGKIARVNQQAETLFGYTRAELEGSPIDRLIPARSRRSHAGQRQDYMQMMVTRSMGAGLNLHALRKDGTEFPVDIMLSPVHLEEGQMVICAVRNITEQKRLQAELAETHRRLFESIEAERLRIAQDLHDGPIQELYGLTFYMDMLKSVLQEPADLEELDVSMENLQGVVQSLRGICGELRPPVLDQFGLEKAIQSHLNKVRETHPDIEIEAKLDQDHLDLPKRVRLALFRIYQTAISNTLRHAGASQVWVDFGITEDRIALEIRDNGRGFHVPERWIDLAREGHFGLVGMEERAQALDGHLQVQSEVGRGTSVRVTVPNRKMNA